MSIKFATFNVENLFGRATVLNFREHSDGDEKLKVIADLQNELKRNTYDKPTIIALYKQVESLIKINVTRKADGFRGFKVVVKSGNSYRVEPDGRDDWSGLIQFKRDRLRGPAMDNMRRVIDAISADVLCMVEVDNRPALEAFNSDVLSNRYDFNMLIDGNDGRGIDVGLYSNLDLGGTYTHIFEGPRNSRVFSRDCLETEVITPLGESVWLLINHLKSKSGGNSPSSRRRRKRQADRVAEILNDGYDLTSDYVMVTGDLNDTPGSDPISSLTQHAHLTDVLELQFPDPADRWTYHFNSNEQIDYILVSDPLRDRFLEAGVERRGMHRLSAFTGGANQSFLEVTSARNAASDHGAVWVDLDI